MPYLLAHWCAAIEKDNKNPPPDSGRILRVVPKDGRNKNAIGVATSSVMLIKMTRMSRINMDVILMTCDLIKQEIETLNANKATKDTDDASFQKYSIATDKIIFSGYCSHIYEASNSDKPDELLVGRVFEPNEALKNSAWLKLLKHLGKRNPNLIGTWAMFHDIKNRIVIFQEYAIYGNLRDHLLNTKTPAPEPQVIEWAQQIFRGMDFLGTLGICHRCICPKHLLLCRAANPDMVSVKLSSFRDSAIYLDTKYYQVIHQVCRDMSRRPKEPFQAPEVFGDNNEEFDPIVADVWSYGATFFFAGSMLMPYDVVNPPDDIELAIQSTIDLSPFSPDACRWFGNLMKGNSEKRITFDQIEADPWYQTFMN